jgi:hypothetical protein
MTLGIEKNPDKSIFTKILAITGTVLVWFPILAPVLLSIARFVGIGRFQIDYLMPAELTPFWLVGGGLLLWAALRRRSHRGMIGWGLGLSIGLLVAGQALAVLTGLASGEHEAVGWRFALVLSFLFLFILALILTGVGGILLLRDLFSPGKRQAS